MSEEPEHDEGWIDFDAFWPSTLPGEKNDLDDEWVVHMALEVIRNNPPEEKLEGDGHKWKEYEHLACVKIVSRALRERPELIIRLLNSKPRDRAIYVARRVASFLTSDKGRNPTKGEILRVLDHPGNEEVRKAICPSDVIPKTTLSRFWKDAGLSHLEQDRGG